MAEFPTEKGQWTEVKLPFGDFTGSFRGMKLKDEKFDPSKISRAGLLLADKKAGPFKLEVDWVRTYGGDDGAKDLIETALADGRFSILAKALTAADFVEFLQGDSVFTVFAPTDEAFEALPKGTLENLLKRENKQKLQAILKYHVLKGSTDLATALGAGEAKSIFGEPVTIRFSEGRVRVNDAALVNADIRTSNGIIHVLDAVLLPPTKKQSSKDWGDDSREAAISPVERIEQAIERGVPIFNGGDHEKCATLYRECLMQLATDGSVDKHVARAMRELIERADGVSGATERAWILRRGLDHVHAAFRQR